MRWRHPGQVLRRLLLIGWVLTIIGANLFPLAASAVDEQDASGIPIQAEITTQEDEATDTPEPAPAPTVTSMPLPTETPAILPTETPVLEPTPTETPTAEPAATVTVTATPTETPGIELEAAAKKELELTVRSDGAAFGEVSPAAVVVGGHLNLQAYPVEGGADYVIPGVVTLRVKSDTAWRITCTIVDTGSSGSAEISALSWRVSGDIAWQSFSTTESIVVSGPAGNTRIDLDYRLHVAWSDGAGALSAIVTYRVSEALEN